MAVRSPQARGKPREKGKNDRCVSEPWELHFPERKGVLSRWMMNFILVMDCQLIESSAQTRK
jgi:hypothetical protein